MPDDILLLILAELRGLRADMAVHTGSNAIDNQICDLVGEVHLAFRSDYFTATEILAGARALPTLSSAISTAMHKPTPRKLGKLLRSVEGADIGGLTVQRGNTDRDGVLWRVASLASLKLANRR